MFQVCEYRSAQVCASIYETLESESPVPQKLELNRLKLNGVGSLPNPFSLSQLSALLCKSSLSSSKTTLALPSVSLHNRTQQEPIYHRTDKSIPSLQPLHAVMTVVLSTSALLLYPPIPAPGCSDFSDLHF